MSALSHFYVFIFLTYPSSNLEIAFFAPYILVFVFTPESKCFVFLSLEKKKIFFFFKEEAAT